MRFLQSFTCLALIATLLNVVGVQAQSAFVAGPTLGFTPENGGTAIRPIIGIPGAAALRDRVELGTEIRGAIISPTQDYAVAARAEDAQFVVIDLRSVPAAITAAAGTFPGADIMAVSPSGSFAAVYDHQSRTIQVVGNILQAPAAVAYFDASRIPGRLASIAISDDGAVALARFVDGDITALWVISNYVSPWPLSTDQPSAVAFIPNSHTAIVAENATKIAYLAVDVLNEGTR